MKLGCDLVQAALAAQFDGAEIFGGGEFELERPLLWSPEQQAAAGRLYVLDSADTAPLRADSLTVYAGGAAHPGSGCCACIGAPAAQVFNFLQQLFDRCDAWERQLDALTLAQSGLTGVLAAAHEMLKNPLIVVDSEFSPVAQFGEAELRMLDLSDADTFSVLKTDAGYAGQCGGSAPFLCSEALLGCRFWSANIGGLPTAHRLLLMEGSAPLRPGSGMLLKYLIPHVRAALLRDQQVDIAGDRLEELLMQVLTERGADYLQLSNQLSRLGWSAEHEYFCLVLRLMRQVSQGLSIHQICVTLRRRYPQCCPLVYRSQIVCYFNATALGKSLKEIARELTIFIRDELLSAGYSRPMRGHSCLRRQFVQAEAALEIDARWHPNIWIHHFDSISMRFLLSEATHRLPGEMICHPGLLALRAHDAKNGTDYLHTLKVYLQHNLNAVRSARALFIHRSTFLYRLDRILEILDSALDDPEELTYLSVSFMLLDEMEKR